MGHEIGPDAGQPLGLKSRLKAIYLWTMSLAEWIAWPISILFSDAWLAG